MIPSLLISQNTIKATFIPEEDFTWGILYKNSPNGTKYVAQSKFVEGHLVFKLNEKETKGIYKLVYAVPQNEYNFDLIYNGKEDIELKFNLNDGAIFLKSSENILLFSYLSELTSLGKLLEVEFSKDQINRKAITTIFDTQRELQITYEEKSKGMLVNHFIKANKPYIPSKYEPKSSYIKNQTTDYFKNIDFSNEVLQSSNLLLDKSLIYIYSVVNEGFTKENNYSFNIDQVVAKTGFANPIFRKSFLEKMWQKFVSNDDIIVANYLAERHLIPLANQQNDTSLALKLTQFKNDMTLNKALRMFMFTMPIMAVVGLLIAIPVINAVGGSAVMPSMFATGVGELQKGLAVVGGGIAALGMLGSGLGQGIAAGKAAEAISRNPEAESKIRSMFLVGAAIAESAALYAFVIAIMAIFIV